MRNIRCASCIKSRLHFVHEIWVEGSILLFICHSEFLVNYKFYCYSKLGVQKSTLKFFAATTTLAKKKRCLFFKETSNGNRSQNSLEARKKKDCTGSVLILPFMRPPKFTLVTAKHLFFVESFCLIRHFR